MVADNVSGADVGEEHCCKDDGSSELYEVDIERSYGASIVDKCGDVMHRCGSPEEARGVDANAAASGASISKANKLCGMLLPQGTCSIILKW